MLNIYNAAGRLLQGSPFHGPGEAHTPNVLERTRLLHEAASSIRRNWVTRQAKELYARTIELDPENVEAATPCRHLLPRVHGHRSCPCWRCWRARRIVEPTANSHLYYRLAKAAEQLGDEEKAPSTTVWPTELDATHLPTLVVRATYSTTASSGTRRSSSIRPSWSNHRESQAKRRSWRSSIASATSDADGDRARPSTCSRRRWRSIPGHQPR